MTNGTRRGKRGKAKKPTLTSMAIDFDIDYDLLRKNLTKKGVTFRDILNDCLKTAGEKNNKHLKPEEKLIMDIAITFEVSYADLKKSILTDRMYIGDALIQATNYTELLKKINPDIKDVGIININTENETDREICECIIEDFNLQIQSLIISLDRTEKCDETCDMIFNSSSNKDIIEKSVDEIPFCGVIYKSLSEACKAFGIPTRFAFEKRKEFFRTHHCSIQAANILTLSALSDYNKKKHKSKDNNQTTRIPMIVNGVMYQSQREVANALNISMGTINAKRTKENMSFYEAIKLLYKADISKYEFCKKWINDSEIFKNYITEKLKSLEITDTDSILQNEDGTIKGNIKIKTNSKNYTCPFVIYTPTKDFASILFPDVKQYIKGLNINKCIDLNTKFAIAKFIKDEDIISLRSDITTFRQPLKSAKDLMLTFKAICDILSYIIIRGYENLDLVIEELKTTEPDKDNDEKTKPFFDIAISSESDSDNQYSTDEYNKHDNYEEDE